MFRLTIRDLLWLTLVAAVAFGWLQSDRCRTVQIAEYSQLLNEWKDLTANLLIRSGAAVYKTENIDPTDPAYFPSAQPQHRIIFKSEREYELYRELHSHGIKPVLLAPGAISNKAETDK